MGGFLDSENLVNGTTTAGSYWWGYYPPSQPNVCPGCGRCRECGHPAPAQLPYGHWGSNQHTGVAPLTVGGGVIPLTFGQNFQKADDQADGIR